MSSFILTSSRSTSLLRLDIAVVMAADWFLVLIVASVLNSDNAARYR